MSKVETSPFGGFQKLPFPLVRKNGFRLAGGSVKAARRLCARRKEALTGSAASSTIGARGNGSDLSEIKGDISTLLKGTFLSCRYTFQPVMIGGILLRQFSKCKRPVNPTGRWRWVTA